MTYTPGLVACLIVAGQFFSPDHGGANDVWPRLMGGTAAPESPHPTIRMVSEEVTIRLKKTFAVDGVLHSCNTGNTKTEWVGFPKRESGPADKAF